ncbi:MAG: hypothetical protein WAR01_01995 [Dokdonella sp.]|uniref:hypothetical protein n=3 Tax=Dokdonella sp. TaxID=2291710 RepID=UPI002C5AFDEC|nr:hypothetical protein [Xanthomonadales bacterium]HQX65583.1 hypothetical protein [Dokdonella sp.]HQY55569.1 hypothetical protein [Dokdonella sp.]HQZ62078.1 hypothetical protein [Dokdonella sp.]
MRVRSLFVLVLCLSCSVALASDVADAFWAKQNKEALRDLERGAPLKQIEAVGRLGPDFAAQTAPVLARHLANPDPVIRLAAAEELWQQAARKPDAFATLKPALRIALDDGDAAIAMNAAGALASMDIPEAELATARRRVLSNGVRGHVGFLAARGLVGLDPATPLLPYLLDYYLDAVEAEVRGGSDRNVELGEKALAKLVATEDRSLIAPLQQSLSVTPPATPFLLGLLADFKPKPEAWTDTLLRFTDDAYPDTRRRAWDLIGEQRDAESLARWVPKAAALLANAEMREVALAALSDAAGRSAIGLPELAALATDSAADAAHRVRAIEILAKAADTSDGDGIAAVQASARKHWQAVCTPILSAHGVDDYFKACRNDSSFIVADESERARLIASWLATNADAEAKIVFLGSLESMWSKALPAAAAVRAERRHADVHVVKAAEAALDRIEPAWRERDARAATVTSTASAASPKSATTAGAQPGGRGADGASVYAAIAKGDLAAVKKLVNAGNVHRPVHYPQMQGTPPAPVVIAVNYCGIPQAAAGLKAIIDYLIDLGANPDVMSTDGSPLLDHAKYACPPEIMAALAR